MLHFMDIRLVSIRLPEDAHRSMRIHSVTHGVSLQRMILDAIDAKYPGIRVLDSNPRQVDLTPPLIAKGGSR